MQRRRRRETGESKREANANRSVVDCLGLRATDAELIKNRLTSLSRRTIWSKRNPVALFFFSVRNKNHEGNRQNNRKKDKWSMLSRLKKGKLRINTISLFSREEGQKEKNVWKNF